MSIKHNIKKFFTTIEVERGYSNNWNKIGSIQGIIKETDGNKSAVVDGSIGDVTHVLYCEYNDLLNRFDRLLYQGYYYDVRYVDNPMNLNQFLKADLILIGLGLDTRINLYERLSKGNKGGRFDYDITLKETIMGSITDLKLREVDNYNRLGIEVECYCTISNDVDIDKNKFIQHKDRFYRVVYIDKTLRNYNKLFLNSVNVGSVNIVGD